MRMAAKRDYYLIQEEKKILLRKLSEYQQELDYIKNDYDKRIKASEYYEKELASLQDKYRDLVNKEADSHRVKIHLENTIKSKSEEIEMLSKTFTEKMSKVKKSSGYNELKEEYERKLNEMIERKDYYKRKVLSCFYIVFLFIFLI